MLKRSVKIINGLFPIRFLVIANLLIFAKLMSGNLHWYIRYKNIFKKPKQMVFMQSLLILGLEQHSPTKGVAKIGEHDIERNCTSYIYMDKLKSKKKQFNRSSSKCKKN